MSEDETNTAQLISNNRVDLEAFNGQNFNVSQAAVNYSEHVHSTNLLSRKHQRSQICDNCSSEPVSVRCAMDNLVLCQECDWDAHGSCSVSASHDRILVEGFSGCPSARELASLWGIDLEDKKVSISTPLIQNWTSATVDDASSWMCD
ncbi:Zinc finger protein CONSTANS-LIKE 14 [Morella rubra]|uniref:Zinc finger protein CONSTANS-LIKE 14 n=1 Tax=Morella rubra TaxID=262757 RepID=A0A6A1V4J0_9ROSI|nr:Zinc finger protein CONSTANS-LIKE 14 [Morella rubra]